MTAPDKALNKLILTITATDTAAAGTAAAASTLDWTLIYGVGSGGLTPFEIFLGDMAVGDAKEVTLAAREAEPFLGCLYPRLLQQKGGIARMEQVRLKVMLKQCEPAQPSEIVQFMARSLSEGGCGGGCGCGCSSHDHG